jgi:antitoxin HicB
MNTYRIIVSYSEATKAFTARSPELEHCEAEGATRAEAIAKLEEELNAQLENMQAQGVELPRPVEEIPVDGELKVKVSAALHRELIFLARSEGIELDTLLVELLTRSVSQRWSGARGGGRPRQEGGRGPRREEGQGSRYHNIMENRADFIEYVRGLETGQPGRGGGGGGGGGGRGPRGPRR